MPPRFSLPRQRPDKLIYQPQVFQRQELQVRDYGFPDFLHGGFLPSLQVSAFYYRIF